MILFGCFGQERIWQRAEGSEWICMLKQSMIFAIIINRALTKKRENEKAESQDAISRQHMQQTAHPTSSPSIKAIKTMHFQAFSQPNHITLPKTLCWRVMFRFKFFYQFFVTMQTVDKLYTNSTNRFPILPEPILNFPLRPSNPALSFSPATNPHLQSLFTMRLSLEHTIAQAQQQQQMMQQLFDSLAKAERGEVKFQKKMKRRCNKDILDRFYCTQDNCKRVYSSQTSLQRHVKIKHGSGRKVPPQLFRDLPPEPNLTEKSESQEESHCCLEMKGGETTNNRELT